MTIRKEPNAVTMTTSALDYADFDGLWTAFHRGADAPLGQLFMGVRTTGIYCRPGCPARQPKRTNVRFFATASAAERSGFRACKRCHPNELQPNPKLAMVESACRYIDEHYDDDVRLEALADALGVSTQTLQRTFREVIGISPRVYARERRLDQFRDELRGGSDVSQAIYGAGFSSPSRVYERAGGDLGMTPAQYRRGAPEEAIRVALGQSPFGIVGVGRTEAGICSIRLGDSPDDVLSAITSELPHAEIALVESDPDLDRIVAHVVAGTSITDLSLDLRGTAFQRKVWTELRRIPRGEQRTYQQIAEQVGSPRSVRAVANACGANPTALAVPCHRVIRSDGTLGGYRWGVERKQAILTLEQAG
jgi:AraC family transcriptional regulator, regulatory protein of adaptative response / methylated-DNA-[protein]-cysteine methyltransferase